MSEKNKERVLVAACLAILISIVLLLSSCEAKIEKIEDKCKVCSMYKSLIANMLLDAAPDAPTWGQNDPPAEWQGWFGNDNNARLNFVQMQALEKQQAEIYGVNRKTPDGKQIHQPGLIEKTAELESLFDRVKKLEEGDPNE